MGKNVIITGTSRGIGLELVKLFAENNDQVLALSRNPHPTDQLEGDNITSIPFDITQEQSLQKVETYINKNWSSVDILLHNAGQLVKGDFKNISLPALKSVYDTNVFGVYELTQKIMPLLHPKSHVIAISSMGGIQGSVKFPGLTAYSSSKAAVINLMEVLAEEYKQTGPLFNALALGAVQTEMFEEAFPGQKAGIQAREMAQYIYQFSHTGQKVYNGKVLSVSNSTP